MIALSLAVSAAKRGKRTILLDASGRQSRVRFGARAGATGRSGYGDVANRQAGLEARVARKRRNTKTCALPARRFTDDVPVTELTSTMLAPIPLCDVLVIDCQTGHFAMGRELLGRDDIRVIVTRPDDASIAAPKSA